MYIPWREFVGVTRAKFDPSAPPLNPANIHQVGFRLSRFDFNNLANPHFKPGPFSLQVMLVSCHIRRTLSISPKREWLKRKPCLLFGLPIICC